jgi:hypothetical protein
MSGQRGPKPIKERRVELLKLFWGHFVPFILTPGKVIPKKLVPTPLAIAERILANQIKLNT